MHAMKRCRNIFFLILTLALITGFGGGNNFLAPHTIPIHDPIYPEPGVPVTFSLLLKNDADANTVTLSVKEDEIDISGSVSSGTYALQQTWNSPVSFPLNYTAGSGFSSNRLITYKFEITDRNGEVNYHEVTFAINPDPRSAVLEPSLRIPAPVYVTGNQDKSCNIVFICEPDMQALLSWEDSFYTSIKENILNGIFSEPFTSLFPNMYSFYVNPETGRSDYPSSSGGSTYGDVANYINLTFAEGLCFLHNSARADMANISSKCFSAENYNRGTFIHESAHVLYQIYDEYLGGKHCYDPASPNNWDDMTKANEALRTYPDRSITTFYEPDKPWYVVCDTATCMMGASGATVYPFGSPCQAAIVRWLTAYSE